MPELKVKSFRLTPAQCVVRAFGSINKTAKILKVPRSTVASWTRRMGLIPAQAQSYILHVAKTQGLSLTADQIVLGDEDHCPN